MENTIVEEFKRCKADPVYFLSRYIKVTHPTRGLVPFKLYPFQERIVDELQNNRFNILRKFRQAGCTTISAAYSLWLSVFYQHKTVVILSRGDVESTEVLDRIKIMYEELPEFFKPGIAEDNKHTLKLRNSSVIKSRPSGKQSGRSLSSSLLIIDEAAFIENIDSIWAAVYPIISTGGRAFILSTVNGMGNWYYQTYTNAKEKRNAFNLIDINWEEHPEYCRHEGYGHLYKVMENMDPPILVDEWEEITKANITHKKWLQEYECEFLGTGDTYIEGDILELLNEKIDKEYHTKYNNRMRVWKDPYPMYDYIIGVDVALGRDRDYSAFQVVNLYNGEVVAEFYSNKTPINEFSKIIFNEATYYNTASVVVERNTIGNNVIETLFDTLEYENLWHDDKGLPGFQVTARNRDSILAELEESIRTNLIKINSERTINELNTFVITAGGKVSADSGKNDDLIMSLSLANHVMNRLIDTSPVEFNRETAFKKDPMMPSKNSAQLRDSYGGITKEELKWLMK